MTIDKRFDAESIEDEWQAQERALELERHGARGDAGTPRERRYRALARVLAEPPLHGLPPDFAAVVARQARALDADQEAREQRFERRLMAAMCSLLALAVAAVAVFYGAELVAILRAGPAASPATASWLYVLLGAISLSCVWQRLQARQMR